MMKCIGDVEFLDGNFPEATAAYRSAAESSDSPRTRQYHLRSVAHASMEQFREAYDTLEESLVPNGANLLAGRHLTADGLWRGLGIYVIGDWKTWFQLAGIKPAYPTEAAVEGLLQGYVDLEFTVTRTGSTKDVRVLESSAPVFERPAIEAAESFRYKPRLVGGEPVEALVQHRVEFQSEGLD